MKTIISTSCFALFLAGALAAQETQHLAFDIGGGFTQTVGGTGRNLDNGWALMYMACSHVVIVGSLLGGGRAALLLIIRVASN
jgi:hypothetical protein